MRRISGFVALFVLIAHTAQAQAVERPAEAPAIVTTGFTAYETKGLRAALGAWLQGSPASTPTAVDQMVASMAPIETAYGAVTGHEILRVVSVGPSVRRVYGIIKYERGPLFIFFDCYRSGADWIIPMFLTNTRASEILPASMLSGER